MSSITQAAADLASKAQELVGANASKTILVTGGSGFVASHVLHSFLARGYRVRTTVRSEAKAAGVKAAHARFAGRLEFAIVPDVAAPGAHDAAVRDVAGVIHVASPFHFNVTDNKTQLLDPAVHGTTSILASVKAHAPQVTRVVITSSFAAIINLSKGMWPEHTYSEADWNPVTFDEAVALPAPGAYSASKTFAERAAYDFVEREKPNFTVAAINPPYIFGPVAHAADIKSLNTSSQELWQFIDGSLAGKPIPPTGFPVFVDVRDVAAAHLRAYEGGNQSQNERFFTVAGQFQNPDVVRVLREHFADRAAALPGPEGSEYVDAYKVDNSKSVKELGLSYIGFDKCIVDSLKSLVALEQAQKEGRPFEWRPEDYA